MHMGVMPPKTLLHHFQNQLRITVVKSAAHLPRNLNQIKAFLIRFSINSQ
jgi:hypothetical protein